MSKRQTFNASTTLNLIKPNFAFHTDGMDLIGSLHMGIAGVKYIIVAFRNLTKWVKARAIKDLLANTVAKFVLK